MSYMPPESLWSAGYQRGRVSELPETPGDHSPAACPVQTSAPLTDTVALGQLLHLCLSFFIWKLEITV